MGSFEHVQNTLGSNGCRVSNGQGESTHYFQVHGVHQEGPSAVFTSCASSLSARTKYVNILQTYIYMCYQEKCATRNFNEYRVKNICGSVHGALTDTPSPRTRGSGTKFRTSAFSARFSRLNLLLELSTKQH